MKAIAFALLLITVSGCATARRAAPNTNVLNEVKRLALAYHNYSTAFNSFPAKIEELTPFVDGDMDLSPYEMSYSGRIQDCKAAAETLLLRQREPLPGGEQAVT